MSNVTYTKSNVWEHRMYLKVLKLKVPENKESKVWRRRDE